MTDEQDQPESEGMELVLPFVLRLRVRGRRIDRGVAGVGRVGDHEGDRPAMSTDTLHDKIRSEVERRLAIARAAAPGPWRIDEDGDVVAVDGITTAQVFSLSGPQLRATADFVALHDPADAIRRYEYALKALDRHTWVDSPDGLCGQCCDERWPCPELRDLAESLGIDTGGQP